MRLRKIKQVITIIVFALSFVYLGVPAYAAETIEEDTITRYVGEYVSVRSSELKINGKKYKKLKKKIKTIS